MPEPTIISMIARVSHIMLKYSFRINLAINKLKIMVTEELLLSNKILPKPRAVVLNADAMKMNKKPVIQ